jgi:Fe-S-cluster containining protein
MEFFVSSLDSEEARTAVYEAVDREARTILAMPPGKHRAREIHRRVDEAIQYFGEIKPEAMKSVRCHKGCGHCCRLWVGVTRDEGKLLAEAIREGRVSIDRTRLEVQRTWISPMDFIGKPREEASCVFLGQDGACGIYEDRPSVCRAVLMASDPELCRTGDCSTQITAIINPYAELWVSAAQSADMAETGHDAPNARLLAAAVWEALHPA